MPGGRVTILDAVEVALREAGGAQTSGEILRLINDRNLYDFKAKDPGAVLRAAIRKHLKAGGTRIAVVGADRYVATP